MGDLARFKDEECTCEHHASVHDDGFGCTAEGCDCLADWEFQEPE